MARTINGNLIGKAAHRTIDEQMENLEPTPTDVRIGNKIKRVRELMGDKFADWYKTTPFSNSLLEKALDEKLVELSRSVIDDLGESPTQLRTLYGYG